MKRYLEIFGFVFIGVIAGLIVRGIPIVLQVQAGGGVPQADRNGDVNGDARLDMSDAIYLLLHIFRDGPQPVAFAQAEPADLGGLEGSLGSIADSLQSLSDGECLSNPRRFINNGQGIITDTCLGLMWVQNVSNAVEGLVPSSSAYETANNFEFRGYNDWRLPTMGELRSLMLNPNDAPVGTLPNDRAIGPFNLDEAYIWTSDQEGNGNFSASFRVVNRPFSRNRTTAMVLPVRDITPHE